MAKVISAGLLMYCRKNGLKIFLVHPGGPFFKNKDNGWWGIPKGLPEDGEDLLQAAKREFQEETGVKPEGNFVPLGDVVQKGGKNVYAWAFECGNDDPFDVVCNTCTIEWPIKSGKFITIPEIDRGEFFTIEEAKEKINQAQFAFIEGLLEHLK